MTSTPGPTPKGNFADLKKDLQDAERASVEEAELDSGQLAQLSQRLYQMILYGVSRHDWYSEQCHKLLQIGLALIASGIAILALFERVSRLTPRAELLAWLTSLSMFSTGAILAYVYNRGLRRDHPYRKVVDIKSWYFAYQFPELLVDHLDEGSPKARSRVEHVSSNIKRYFDKLVPHIKDAKATIREDIEQVAILLVLQRYRTQQRKLMSSVLFVGIIVTGLFLFALFLDQLPGIVTSLPFASTATLPVSTPPGGATAIPRSPVPASPTATETPLAPSPTP